MSDKKSRTDPDYVLQKIAAPSVFDKLVKEIDPTEIPSKYIEKIVVYYKNGSVVQLKGSYINHPMPINSPSSWKAMSEFFKDVNEFKVYVDTEKVEKDVNELLSKLLDDY